MELLVFVTGNMVNWPPQACEILVLIFKNENICIFGGFVLTCKFKLNIVADLASSQLLCWGREGMIYQMHFFLELTKAVTKTVSI